MKIKNIFFILCAGFIITLNSCTNDFLNREPLSSITPDKYLNEESQLAAYSVDRYGIFPTHTWTPTFANDNHTDNMGSRGYSNIYAPGQWKVGQTGGDWSFGDIYQCNYFLQSVVPQFEVGKIAGNADNIKHYIGEIYMIRAYVYFTKLQALGDFPIIKGTLPDDKAILTAASKRSPRTEVARFIISDLDSAIMLMKDVAPDGNGNRLSKKAALLLKSRVALFEGTWLKYFKGTAFVPNGTGWPGKSKDYNASYNFASGSIDSEISYFFTQAMESSKLVADAIPLVANNMVIQQATSDPVNPYCAMFSDVNMSVYKEVLFWRRFDKGLGITNNAPVEIGKGNSGVGLTRGFVDGFLMANGLPIYANGSGYAGDDSIQVVRKDRDGRLFLFLKQPGQKNILYPSPDGTHATPVEIIPDIMNILENSDYPLGYALRKGMTYDAAQCGNGLGWIGSIVFRGVEAYLNYIEASYEKNGTIDATAKLYWQQIRTRAGVDPDLQKTINATDLSKEALNDWGVYSAGNMVDKTLYNIRRERRCELMAEGLRYMDLRRWRAMDQMIVTPYHIEGFKIWGPMQKWYKAGSLTYSIGDKSTMSAPTLSNYIRPYEKTPTSLVFNGYKWTMAHYLNPIAVQNFLITSENNDVTESPIYQNPGWPITANSGPTGL